MLPENGNTLDSDGSPPPKRDLAATNDLYATIKGGNAKLDSLKLLIDGFEILEELGRGAYGVVYRARDEKLDRQVAIKISLLDDPSRREQYIKEAKNAAKLDNPGIVPVFQVGTLAGGQPFVVQRLIDGDSLRKVLADSGKLDTHHACWMMSEIAGAVAKAHAVGMIHRDLKPDNILVDSTGKPWVADFGLAILEEDQGQHRGERAGTPLYMSPEQLRGRTEWLDGRADIYAMGIMLYEMLVGRTPFDARNLAELEEQVLHRDPKPISQRSPDIPAVMDIIFQNCCAKQVNDRYSNAYEFVSDLEAVMAEIPEVSTQVSGQNKSFGSMSVSRKSISQIGVSTRRKTLRSTIRDELPVEQTRRYAMPLIFASVLGLAGLGAYMFWNPEPEKKPDVANVEQAGEDKPKTDVAPPQDAIPTRPFKVSRSDKAATHTSIQAAIAMAEIDETIFILPGTYVESLVLDRNIKLQGEGNSSDIFIIGEGKAALVVQNNAQVELANLTLEGKRSDSQSEEFNTVDVQSGNLTIDLCNVYSRSYDCIKVQPNSALKATNCSFRSTAHPAIYAKEAANLQVIGCDFDIKAQTLEGKNIAVGIQANHCPGLVRKCNFGGSGSSYGIHWMDSKVPVNLEDLTFDSCDIGILLQDCSDVQIRGSVPTKMTGCRDGIWVQRSAANIDGLNLDSAKGSNNGIRVVDSGDPAAEPSVTLANCEIHGFDVSLSVENSNVVVKNLRSSQGNKGIQLAKNSKLDMSDLCKISQCEYGIYIEDATAILNDCLISDNLTAGILVDAGQEALRCVDCTLVANNAGLIIYAGSVALHGGAIQSNKAGIAVAAKLDLQAGQPTEPTFLDFQGVIIKDNENFGLAIQKACSYLLGAGTILSDPGNNDQPQLGPGLKTEKNGDRTVVFAAQP